MRAECRSLLLNRPNCRRQVGIGRKLAPAPVIEDEYVPEYINGARLSEKLRIGGVTLISFSDTITNNAA